MKNSIFILGLLFLLSMTGSAQTANLSIVDQRIDGGNYSFTVGITAMEADGFLGNSDFILSFNLAGFSNPSISVTGEGTFGTESGDDLDALFTQRGYGNSTAAALNDNTIQLNLSGPNPGSDNAFLTGVAKFPVGMTVNFATFTISGYQGGQDIELAWTDQSIVSTVIRQTLNEADVPITTTPPAEVLPVELLLFEARHTEKRNVALNWQTVSEDNNSGFAVEHSTDGQYWATIDFVNGYGTTQEAQDYLFIHREAVQGNNYYRLKQVDLDQAFTYSGVQLVRINEGVGEFSVYPNPATDQVRVQLTESLDKGMIRIVDQLGREVLQRALIPNTSGYNLQLGGFPAGVYYITLATRAEKHTKRLILR